MYEKSSFVLASSMIFEKTSAREGNNSILINMLEVCQIEKNRATEAILKIALDLRIPQLITPKSS